MKEINVINTETIERSGLDKSILRKRSSAKTFSGWLIACIKKARDNKNWETAFFLEDIYHRFKDFHPVKLNTVTIVNGWKGKDTPEIFKDFNEDFTIIMHQKNKEGEVQKIEKQIKKEDVNIILTWVRRFKLNEKHSCHEVAKVLGYNSWKDLWKERKEYFKRYYYPIKVLEALKLIKYSGKGTIQRIK